MPVSTSKKEAISGASSPEAAVLSRRQLAAFLEEVRTVDTAVDAGLWTRCGQVQSPGQFEVFKQYDSASGLYRLRLTGVIHARAKTVTECLYDWKVRSSWDSVMAACTEFPLAPHTEENSEEFASEQYSSTGTVKIDEMLVHVQLKSPVSGVTSRDFAQRRIRRVFQETGEVQIVDISVVDEQVPVNPKFVRASTLFSGALIKPHPENPDHAVFETITHVDVGGYVPKMLINMLAASTTVGWLKNLGKACETHDKGQLVK